MEHVNGEKKVSIQGRGGGILAKGRVVKFEGQNGRARKILVSFNHVIYLPAVTFNHVIYKASGFFSHVVENPAK